MRIVFFLAHPEGIGGASNVMLKHAYMMKSIGNDVLVVIQNNMDGEHCENIDIFCRKYDLETRACIFPVATCIEEIDIMNSIWSSEIVETFINEFRADIVHSLQINTAVEIACRNLGIPHVMSIYPLSDGMFNIKWLDILPRFIVGDSEYYIRRWGSGLGADTKCIRVVYTEKDIKEVSDEKKSFEFEVLNIGVFTNYKNQLEVIKFVEMAISDGRRIHLTFLGDDSTQYGIECRRYVSLNGLEEFVSFEGFVIDLEPYFKEADALIHVSDKESYPGVIVEAMANRIPVMVNPVAGIPEIVKDNVNGFWINGSTCVDIMDTFTRFDEYKASGRIQEIIYQGYDTYIKNHSVRAVLDELNSFYSQCLKKYPQMANRHFNWGNDGLFRDLINECMDVGDFTYNHIWYIWHIKEVIKTNSYKTACIWGAGNYGAYGKEWCDILGLDLVFYLDEVKRGEYFGRSIKKPSLETIKMVDVVFVGIANYEMCKEVSERLVGYGLERNRNYFLLLNNPCL